MPSARLSGFAPELSDEYGLPGWRQHKHHVGQFKKAHRHIQKLKHSNSKDEQKRQEKQEEIQQAHRNYLDLAGSLLGPVRDTRQQIAALPAVPLRLAVLDDYLKHADRQVDQIRHQVLEGEAIPHAEKVFSIFQPHTEWISFDKGFHSPANQAELKKVVGQVVLPRKGKLSRAAKAIESEAEFVRLRRKHSAVESAINALEVHGLDRCPDDGIDGFKRYVALAVVARNIQRLGAVLKEKEARRRGPDKKAA